MEQTLADEIYEFATSYPVDSEICERIRVVVEEYITETMGMDYYHVMLDGESVVQQPGLKTPRIGEKAWCNDGADSVPIHGNDEYTFRAQSTYAYQEQKALWIIAKAGEKSTDEDVPPLHFADEYVEMWSGAETAKLPKYRDKNKKDIKTSIVVPIRHGDKHVIGFICLESKKLLKISPSCKKALRKLADAIGAVFVSKEIDQKKKDSVLSAMKKLEGFADEHKFCNPLEAPIVFFASSNVADEDVRWIVTNDVAKKFEVNIFDWRDDKAPGDIPKRIREVIKQCRVGICYFSQPVGETNSGEFIDNPNVLFEAGMLDYLVNSSSSAPKDWIPIREKNSPQAPFDFAQQRMVFVERSSDSQKIKEKELRNELFARLSDFLVEKEGD
jgi:hypothetical protein